MAVVTVTRNTKAQLRALLDGLADDPGRVVAEVVVVDNDSTDGTAEMAAAHPLRPRYLRNSPGRGFAAAVNQGFRETTAADVAIATASTRLDPGVLAALARVLREGERVGAVGPLIRGIDGVVQRHGLFAPRPLTAASVLLGLDVGPFRRERERYYGPHRPGPAIDVDNLSGAMLVVRREAWEDVGGFDERFFLYCEDVDWSLRARERGWRLRFVPEVEVRREKSLTARGAGAESIRLYYRSLRAFYRKHHGRSPLVVCALWLGGATAREWIDLGLDRAGFRKGLRY